MLRETLEGGLIDPQDDVAHRDPTALCSWLARKQLLNSHHAGAVGFAWYVFFTTKAEAQPRCVLQQAHLKHIICWDKDTHLEKQPKSRINVSMALPRQHISKHRNGTTPTGGVAF